MKALLTIFGIVSAISESFNILSADNIIVCTAVNCTVDCQSNGYNAVNCTNKMIDYSMSTESVKVLCGENSCMNTIINCPQYCDIQCKNANTSCYNKNTTIIYNDDYYDDINIYCTVYGSCEGLNFLINNENDIQYDDINETLITVNIYCNDHSACSDAIFKINSTNIDTINIYCNGDDGRCQTLFDIYSDALSNTNVIINCQRCENTIIKAPMANSLSLSGNAEYINLYPPYLHKYSTVIAGGKYIYIHVPIFYTMDFLLVTSNKCAYRGGPSNAPRSYSRYIYICCMSTVSQWSSSCTLMSGYYFQNCECGGFCCPVSTTWNTYNCTDDRCVIDFKYTNDYSCSKAIIYANNASYLSITADTISNWIYCNDIHIYASNVSWFNMDLYGVGSNIKIYAKYVEHFSLNCFKSNRYYYDKSRGCKNLLVDVSFANNVNIHANQLTNSIILAQNAQNFNVECANSYILKDKQGTEGIYDQCKDLILYIPLNSSNSYTSLQCVGKDACQNLTIYTNNGLTDIDNLDINFCELCNVDNDKCLAAYYSWNVYCNDSFLCYQYKKDIYRLQDILNNAVNTNYDECPALPIIKKSVLGIFLAAVSFIILVIVFLILIWSFIILKYLYPLKYKELFYVRPASLYLLGYFHFFDLFMWITQFYILSITMTFHVKYGAMCNVFKDDYENDDVSFYCESMVQCTNDCSASSSMKTINILISFIMFSLLLYECFKIYKVLSHTGPYKNKYLYSSAADAFAFRFLQFNHTKWNDYLVFLYYSRKLFKCSPCGVIWQILYNSIRYILFFILVLVFYNDWDGFAGNIEWYDIFPILLVWISHQVTKTIYSIFPAYNEKSHILWILEETFGAHISSIINEYLLYKMVPSNHIAMAPLKSTKTQPMVF